MEYNKFTEEQIQALSKNPNVIKVSESSITYSEEFKKAFILKYNSGKLPSEIFREAGLEPSVLKKSRIRNFAYQCKKYNLRPEGTLDTRKTKSGRPITKNLTTEEQLERLKHKNLVLEQEIDFLKKLIYLGKKTEWEKSRLKKNTK